MTNTHSAVPLHHRYLARIVLEASTPLFVGSGDQSPLHEALVQRDPFGFPMIPGTSLMGVLRHALYQNKTEWGSFFGYHEDRDGEGSRLKISAAYLLIDQGKVAEGEWRDTYERPLRYFKELPRRQHVRITHRGVADTADNGLFSNEVVYQGCRVKFELELKSDGSPDDEQRWMALLAQFKHPGFRIGQGTRKGYGALMVRAYRWRKFNLGHAPDCEDYLHFDPSLNALEVEKQLLTETAADKAEPEGGIYYRLKLKPDAYFHFGGGPGDEEVAHTTVSEWVMRYDEEQSLLAPDLRLLVPAASIKGALRHRTCFHYNVLQKCWAEAIREESDREKVTGTKNAAVYTIFGSEREVLLTATVEGNPSRKMPPQRGHLIINDQDLPAPGMEKIFNHVAIDRFTGGASDGALFSEKANRTKGLTIDLYLDRTDFDDSNIITALERALYDICRGLLPLGGMVTKGHGIFTGQLLKDSKPYHPYDHNH